MRRRCWEILSFALAGCILMGCGGASKDNASVQSDIPEHITEQYDEYFKVDAEVKAEQPEKIFQYSASLYVPETDKLQEAFFPGEEVETESNPEQWTNICMSADKKRRASTAIGVRYQDSDYADYYALLSSGDVSHFFPEDFSNITTVPAVSAAEPDKVKKEVMELAEKLEIKLQKEPYVFVGLEAEGLKQLYQEQADTYIQNGIELPQYLKDLQVSEDMECYYMLWQVECPKGEVLRNANLSLNGMFSSDGAFVMAIYTPGGV